MVAIDNKGWLTGAKKRPSPNYDARDNSASISLLVIHNISLPPASYEGDAVERFFLNQLAANEHPYFEKIEGLCVSAHLFIRRSGELIQFVSLEDRAWHAGQSCFNGETACNNYSIGIELEGTDTEAYTDQQYQQLLQVTEAIHQTYPSITIDRIVGHEHVAPGRKTDPGESFDWKRYLTALNFSNEPISLPVPQQQTK
jgi:AmpD protein